MKPANFPERKRQRQLRALSRLNPALGRLDRAYDQARERRALTARTARDLRDARTKKHLASGSPARQARHGGKLVRR